MINLNKLEPTDEPETNNDNVGAAETNVNENDENAGAPGTNDDGATIEQTVNAEESEHVHVGINVVNIEYVNDNVINESSDMKCWHQSN